MRFRPSTLVLVCLLHLGTAHAVTFTVTSTDDSGPGTLRQAILDANVDSNADVIDFAIGTGVQTILPASALPLITEPVDVDGTTQPGFAGAPLVVIDGTNVPAGQSGLVLSGQTGSRIRGLVINRFAVDFQTGGNGILISGGGEHTIEGNYLGTNVSGTIARPNGRYGVACDGCTSCTIGGTTAGARNLLSGNLDAGILIQSGSKNVIQGNWIGLDATGAAVLGNENGIFMLTGGGTGSTENLIGGDDPGAGNVIAGNLTGIVIGNSGTAGNVVRGNLIGTDATGKVAIGNAGAGIEINSAPATSIVRNVVVGSGGPGIRVMNAGADATTIRENRIGVDADGTIPMPNGAGIEVRYSASGAPVDTIVGAPGGGNVIAHNTGNGITVLSGIASNPMTFVSPTEVGLIENRIFANGGLAVDLENDGVTANDPDDADDGANGLQNFPVVTGVTDMGDATEFTATLDAAPGTEYRIELFENTAADPSGNGEAESPLGTADVVTDGDGHADVAVQLPVTVTPGSFVTATATDESNDTSELSPAFQVGGAPTTTSSTTSTVEPTTTTSSTEAPTTTTSSTAPPITTTTSTAAPTSTTVSTGPPITVTTSTSTTTSTGATTTTTSSSTVPTTSTTAGTTSSTSSSTTTPAPTTTTTTLAPCMPPDGGPFDLIRCGLDALAARIAAENALGVVQAKLSLRLATATQAVDDARAACRVRKTGRAKRTLGKVTRALGQVVKILRSRKAREVPEVLRTELTADGKAILGDVVLVKVGLVCP